MLLCNLVLTLAVIRLSLALRQSGALQQSRIFPSAATKIPIETDKLPINLILEKGLDTLEDAALHARRLVREKLRVPPNTDRKPRVVLIGSGWASHAFSKVIDTELFDVTCISPRPFFVFTPMLPACSAGTIEYRSIIEPIRASNPEMNYIEGEVVDLDPLKNEVAVKAFDGKDKIKVSYDALVYGVGAEVGDFGLAGVKKYCYFIKEIEDAKKLKKAILERFEKASLPGTSEHEKKKLLHFVIVGGGPTGVEFAGELADLTREEAAVIYPKLRSYVQISLINAGSGVLQAFDVALQEAALSTLRKTGVDVILQARVTKVEDGVLGYQIKQTKPPAQSQAPTQPAQGSARLAWPGTTAASSADYVEMQYGLCVWATGVAARPITKRLAERLGTTQRDAVASRGRLKVDPWLRIVRNEAEEIMAFVPEYAGPFAPFGSSGGDAPSRSSTGGWAGTVAGAGAGEVVPDGSYAVREARATKPVGNTIFAIGDCAGEVLLLEKKQSTNPGKEFKFMSAARIGDKTLVTWKSGSEAGGGSEVGGKTGQAVSEIAPKRGGNSRQMYKKKRYQYLPSGYLLPQTAQVAAQQGAYVARLLNRQYDIQGAAPPLVREATVSLRCCRYPTSTRMAAI